MGIAAENFYFVWATAMGRYLEGDSISTKIRSVRDQDRDAYLDLFQNVRMDWVGHPDFLTF